MSTNYVAGVQLWTCSCGECGGVYAITERHRKQCQEKGKGWTCPYCETNWGYFGQTESQRLRKELESAHRELDQALSEASEQRQKNKQVTRSYQRVRERISAGVCPCCDEIFENVASHMASEHPKYGGNQRLRTLRLLYGLTQAQVGEEAGVPAAYVSLYERGMELPASGQAALSEWLQEQSA